jgi:hypothetical protein
MTAELATIAVVPHERFSLAPRSLASVLASRSPRTPLVYIDGGSPPLVRQHLERQAVRHGFQLVSTERFIAPNVARNLAARHVQTRYVAFVDNDVLVEPDWLGRLVECAESTGAWVVGGICCEGEPAGTRVRSAGGAAQIVHHEGKRTLRAAWHHAGQSLPEVRSWLDPQPVEQVELRATLVRMEAFARLGPLDEQLPSLGACADLCLLVRGFGGDVFLEPRSVATYLSPPPFDETDLSYFELRWSEAWNQLSVGRLREKWDLSADDESLVQMAEQADRHRRLPIEPYRRMLRLVGRRPAEWLERVLIAPLEQAANRRRFPLAACPPDGPRRAAA